MRKIFVMAAFVCIAATGVNAQTEETESKNEEMIRLTKAADENPADWKTQYGAGHFLLGNPSQAEKFYERLFHLATDYNKAIPDSVIRETGWTLAVTSMAPEKQNLDRALFYIDMMRLADKMGVDMSDGYTYMFDVIGVICGMMKEESERSLYYMTELRNHLAKDKKPGIEYTDMMTAMLYDELMSKYRETFGDKLLELTIDGKKYIALSMNEWNIEKPLAGWMKDQDQESLYYCCDDGKVTDDLHGQWEFNFYYDKDGVKPQEGANARLITVTPERRQQLVEAYRKYMKKAKKNK
ncbi:MAG: hypothetical protein IJP74_10150 [Prevotella sp.]|nr:hypothetical protein [Prevotella sp.]MBR0049662.1 hypothetical protein [Prevotella sp.]